MRSVSCPSTLRRQTYQVLLTLVCAILASGVSPSLQASDARDRSSAIQTPSDTLQRRIGVVLVSHGSHSERWREMLGEITDGVREDLAGHKHIVGVKTAFMEYTEPSLATQLEAFDGEEVDDIIIVPLFLTVSSHSYDDIPVIAGQKYDKATLENLKLENIRVYKPNAEVHISPLLDFPSVLQGNVLRRVKQMSVDARNEGVVLVAYGDETFNEEWEDLLEVISEELNNELGIESVEYCWCGHIVRYKTDPTENAIETILEEKEKALVVPVLVAVDETFQGKIIGGAVRNVDQSDRVVYLGDAILPDANINQWVIDISHNLADSIIEDEKSSKGDRNENPSAN
jgi:sirohydrochlorin ferrochelatase